MLARLTRSPFDSASHIFELKWDGVRALAFVEGGRVRLQSRNLRDITAEFPEIASLPDAVNAQSAVLDGELVIFDKDGHPSLNRLLERLKRHSRGSMDRGPQATFVAFDVLYVNGESVMTQPLVKRKAVLHKLLKPARVIQPCEFIENDGIAFFKATCDLGLEGIVAKAKASVYTPGRRSPHWLKIKRRRECDFVVGGYDIGGKRALFSSLILGLYDASGRFQFVGEVGTGFTDAEAKRLYARLQKLHTATCPFATRPDIPSLVYWCKPELVCRVEYGEITENGRLRYPVYQGTIDDKAPEDCLIEEAPGWPSSFIQQRMKSLVSEAGMDYIRSFRLGNTWEAGMASRSIWKGAISFGMVTIPVKVFNITSSNDLAFNTLHKTCRQRLRQKRWCPQHEVEVQGDETVRAYEYSKDQYVIVEDTDLESLRVPSTHTVEITQFVDMKKIDPVYFDKSYVLEPEPVGVKPFYLLKQTMDEAGLTALATVSIRQKETLCALRVYGSTIMLHTMYYPDEVRGLGDLNLPEQNVQIAAPEKAMAKMLIDHLTGDFKPETFHDRYREAVLGLIEAKLNSTKPIEIPAAPAQGKVGDLMEALRASIEAAKKASARAETPAAAGKKAPVAAEAQVVAEAAEAEVEGKPAPKKAKARKAVAARR